MRISNIKYQISKMGRLFRVPRFSRKNLKKAGLVFVVLVGLGFFLVFLPAKRLMASVRETVGEARVLVYVAKQQDLPQTRQRIRSTKTKLEETQKHLAFFSPAKFIPFLGSYFRDAESLVKAGIYGLEAGEILVETLEPYAEILGFSGERGKFVELSPEERLETVVKTLDKVTPKLGEMGELLGLAKAEIDKIDPVRYPRQIGETSLRERMEQLKELADQMGVFFVDTQPLIEVLPSLLGEPEPRKYLVLFQNDKELRPAGGFITAYAIFRLEHGKIIVEKSQDIYLLDQSLTKTFPAPEPILKYLPKVYSWHLRDANLSPDFHLSMRQFEEMYQYVQGREEIDGIVAIDTYVLERLIDVLGPINVWGTVFTNEVVEECNCPKVVYELLKEAGQPLPYMRRERKKIIGALLDAILHKALALSPSQYWPKLIKVGLEALTEKHILLYFHETLAQKAVEKLGFAGKIRDFEGDYLHINDTNFAGAKANMYVKHKVEQKIEVDSEGSVVKTLTLKYRNPEPPDDCSLERKAGLCLSATLRNWVRIYVPLGSTLLEAEGSRVEVETKEDLGKTCFEGFFEVRPLGSAQFIVKYKLPFKIKKGEEYRLLIQKQPGTQGHEYVIVIDGKVIEEFKLTTDREVKFRL